MSSFAAFGHGAICVLDVIGASCCQHAFSGCKGCCGTAVV